VKYNTTIYLLLVLLALHLPLWIGFCFAVHHACDIQVGDILVNKEPTIFEVAHADKDEYVHVDISIASSKKKIRFFTTRDRFKELVELIQTWNCEVETIWYEKTEDK